MFSVPGLILLLAVDYFKPQEFVPFLAGAPLLYVFTAMTLVGFAVDLRLGMSRLVPAPQLALVILFVAWCVLSVVPLGTAFVFREAYRLLVPLSLYLLLAHVIQTFRALQWAMGVMLAFGLCVAFIGVHQGLAPKGCHRVYVANGHWNAVHDGRSCTDEDRDVCKRGDAEPGAFYICEHVGLLGTQSVIGRVRFRGTMEDPNEMSLAVGITMPLAFAFFDRRRSSLRLLLLLTTIALAGICAVFTQSRGGQLVFLITLGVYFVNRFGKRGAAVGAIGALPILLMGGRSSGDASASVVERLGCWAAGIRMLRDHPLLGVGVGQFTEHHHQTAHSSLILIAAELGFPGMVLWSSIVYLTIKIPFQALRERAPSARLPTAPVAHSWSLALLAALAGILGGTMLLSYAYKEVLWIYMGLSGALYQAMKRHQPSFHVSFGWKDLGFVVGASSFVIAATAAYSRLVLH